MGAERGGEILRVINLNGYIDEDVWYGDEITPDMLHEQLFA